MAISNRFSSNVYSLEEAVRSLNGSLHSEVYGGKWNDPVGTSYYEYTNVLLRNVENLKSTAKNLQSLENSLESIDDTKDKSILNSLRAEVNRL